MSPEVAVLLRAALVTLAVFALEALYNAHHRGQRARHTYQRVSSQHRSVKTHSQTQSQSSAPVIVQLKSLPKTPYSEHASHYPYNGKRAA